MTITRITAVLLVLVIALSVALALAETWRLSSRHPTVSLELASPDARLGITGFHEPEQDGALHFRWSSGTSEIHLLNAGLGGVPVLHLWLAGGPPGMPAPDLTVAIAGRRLTMLPVAELPRHYQIIVPSALDGDRLNIQLTSATIAVAPDPRQLGVRVIDIALDRQGDGIIWPAAWMLFAPLLAFACMAFCLRSITWRLPAVSAGLIVAAIGWWAIQQYDSSVVAPIYLARLGGGAVLLAIVTALILPSLEQRLAWPDPRIARALWGAALLACAIRLVGTLYPPFDAYDLSLNLGRFYRTIGGMLVDTNRSFEFREGVTVYPAGPYLAFMPGLLLGLTPKLAVQGGIALFDGLGAFAIGLLALRLGRNARAALFAALVYAALPVMLTSLWFGHTAQVFGQGLMAPLALALLAALQHHRASAWLATGALLSMALLSHIGVTILALAWLGLIWSAFMVQPSRRAWHRFTMMLAVAALIGFMLVYGPMAQLKLAEFGRVGATIAGGDAPAYNLIFRAFQISFYELGWMLAIPGIVLLSRDRHVAGGLALVGAWAIAALIFWAVEMLTGLQVRYLVFLAPLMCIAIGSVLARTSRAGLAGAVVAWGTLALLVVSGSAPWFLGVYQNIQLSMIPLLR